MKKFTTLMTAAVLLASLSACGKAPMGATAPGTAAMKQFVGDPEVESTTGLHGAFKRVHYAIFDRMDANHDKWLDEYEAGKYMSLDDFRKANTNDEWQSRDRVSRGEFIAWCTHVFLWWHTNANDWTQSFRHDLADVFDRLDRNQDGLLSAKELNPTAMHRIRLSFDYPRLHIHLPIEKVSPDDFKSHDKTGDGQLSQAEFEDLYVDLVVNALAPAAPPAPPSPPSPPGPAPNPPAPSKAPDGPPAPPAPPAPGGDGPPAPPAPPAPAGN